MIPRKRSNLVGIQKGLLTVVGDADDVNGRRRIIVKCSECNTERIIDPRDFHKSINRFCVCFKGKGITYKKHVRQTTQKQVRTKKHPIYEVWKGMRARCRDKKHIGYKNYGGRGINVAVEWNSFETFYNDMVAGYRKGLHLDRIDSDKGYCKENCQWLAPVDNARKSRQTKLTVTIAEDIRNSELGPKALSEKYGVCKATIHHIRRGLVWRTA